MFHTIRKLNIIETMSPTTISWMLSEYVEVNLLVYFLSDCEKNYVPKNPHFKRTMYDSKFQQHFEPVPAWSILALYWLKKTLVPFYSCHSCIFSLTYWTVKSSDIVWWYNFTQSIKHCTILQNFVILHIVKSAEFQQILWLMNFKSIVAFWYKRGLYWVQCMQWFFRHLKSICIHV